MANNSYHKEYYLKNKERIRKYYIDNKDKISTRQAIYDKKNRKVIEQRKKNRRKNELSYKLSCLLRIRLNVALKNKQKAGSAIEDLGCSLEFLKEYLEKKFKVGMTWENHSQFRLAYRSYNSFIFF